MFTDLVKFFNAGAILATRASGHCLLVNPSEHLGAFVERSNAATSQRLNAVSDLRERQSGEARGARSGQFGQDTGVDAGRTVSGCTHKCGQRFAKAIAHLTSDVLDSVINSCRKTQRAKVCIQICYYVLSRSFLSTSYSWIPVSSDYCIGCF